MTSAAVRGGRLLAALAVLLATAAALLLPPPDAAFAAGLVAAVLVIIVASTTTSTSVVPAGVHVGTRTRAVLDRMVPRTAQSDPDARGHARPRAPGALLLAV